MKVNVVLYASLTKFSPGVSAGEPISLEVAPDSSVLDIIKQIGIPTTLKLVLLVNGRSISHDHILRNEDRLAVFPLIAGG